MRAAILKVRAMRLTVRVLTADWPACSASAGGFTLNCLFIPMTPQSLNVESGTSSSSTNMTLFSFNTPILRQNTANFKLNYGLPHNLELDVDSPYLSIYRTAGNQPSTGVGDTNMGIKTNFRKESATSRVPALAASFYVEFPTGDASQQLGSGLNDYWLNLDCTKVLIPKNQDHREFRIFVCRQYEYRCAGNPNHTGSCFPRRPFTAARFSSLAHAWSRGVRRIHGKRQIWENRSFRPWLGGSMSFAKG